MEAFQYIILKLRLQEVLHLFLIMEFKQSMMKVQLIITVKKQAKKFLNRVLMLWHNLLFKEVLQDINNTTTWTKAWEGVAHRCQLIK